MSSDELSRLVNDVMTDPAMVAEAMAITDQPSMEAYITGKGYRPDPGGDGRGLGHDRQGPGRARTAHVRHRGAHPVRQGRDLTGTKNFFTQGGEG